MTEATDKAFRGYSEMEAFARVGIALATAQGSPVDPHTTARWTAQQAIATLTSEASPPEDLAETTAAKVEAARQSYVTLRDRAIDRLNTPESLRKIMGINVGAEVASRDVADAWIAAFDAVAAEEGGD